MKIQSSAVPDGGQVLRRGLGPGPCPSMAHGLAGDLGSKVQVPSPHENRRATPSPRGGGAIRMNTVLLYFTPSNCH